MGSLRLIDCGTKGFKWKLDFLSHERVGGPPSKLRLDACFGGVDNTEAVFPYNPWSCLIFFWVSVRRDASSFKRIIRWIVSNHQMKFASSTGRFCWCWPCQSMHQSQRPAGWNTVGVFRSGGNLVSFKYQYSINRYFSESFALLDIVREGRKEVSKYFRATGMYRFPLDSASCTGYTPIHFLFP